MGVVAMEAALVAALKEALPRVNVAPFPDGFDGYEALPLNRGATVLVAYRDGRFGDSQATDLVVQDWVARFEVQVVTASLRGPQGAADLLDAVRLAATGLSLDGSEPLQPVSEEFVDAPKGRWIYAQVYACRRLHVESRAEETAELDHNEFFNANDSTEEAFQVQLDTADPPTATQVPWSPAEE